MTRLFYTILYSAIAALAITQWSKCDNPVELIGARCANAQSPDPTLPGSYDPVLGGGGMNNPNGMNNFNPANPASQIITSQPTSPGQTITKDPVRPASWPSTPAVTWGPPPAKPAAPTPGADGLPGVSITPYQEGAIAQAAAAPPPLGTGGPIGLQYPDPNPPHPTTSDVPNPVAPPSSYPTTGVPPAAPYSNSPYYAPPAANSPPSNMGGAPAFNLGSAPPNGMPPGYPPATPAYPPPANAPSMNAPPGSVPPMNAPPLNAPPGSVPPGSAPPGEAAAGGPPPAAKIDYGKILPGTRIIARVGTEYVLEADLLGPVNDLIARNKDRIPKDQLENVRQELMKQRLDNLLQTKVVLADVRAKIPAEGFKKFAAKLGEQFDEVEVPKAMEKEGAKTRFELDEKLRQFGGSLDREKTAYIERQMAMGWMHEQTKSDKEVTHAEMVEYYNQHAKDYEHPSKARWEQLHARFKKPVGSKPNEAVLAPLEWDPKTGQMRLKSDPSKMAAFRTIAEAGNRVIKGEPFANVAKAMSDGPTASKGGIHDWTIQGSLASEPVDQALFTLPVGQLSPIIEDDRGFHIIRVLERKMAGRTPFAEVQQEIKDTIKRERSMLAMKKYVESLQGKVSVWTIFEGRPMDELTPKQAGVGSPATSTEGGAGKSADPHPLSSDITTFQSGMPLPKMPPPDAPPISSPVAPPPANAAIGAPNYR